MMPPRRRFIVLRCLAVLALVPGGSAAQGHDTKRKCDEARIPRKLPALDHILDSVALVRVLGATTAAGEPREILLSVGFNPDGSARVSRVLESTLGRDSATAVAHEVTLLGRRQKSGDNPWAVRVRMRLGAGHRVVVERSEYCPAVVQDTPGVRSVSLGVLTADEARDAMNARQLRLRVLVGEDGAVKLVEVRQSSGSREFDDTFSREQEDNRYLPALLDGAPVSMWIDHSISVRRH